MSISKTQAIVSYRDYNDLFSGYMFLDIDIVGANTAELKTEWLYIEHDAKTERDRNVEHLRARIHTTRSDIPKAVRDLRLRKFAYVLSFLTLSPKEVQYQKHNVKLCKQLIAQLNKELTDYTERLKDYGPYGNINELKQKKNQFLQSNGFNLISQNANTSNGITTEIWQKTQEFTKGSNH